MQIKHGHSLHVRALKITVVVPIRKLVKKPPPISAACS